ncbi:hypothetical protein MSG28_003294 [Choristoneura fumiferana]|uniref:Uncharacterized protein n=1 Tax=Choristoneura fumiferana TaxID=7141 RepID=A0ACC0KEZ6_CHOFU|nr:hypothetical protein MSG28_003294 [Choristoneura fumiferana]
MLILLFRFTCCFVVIDGSSSDAVRKLSDDLSRKHLSDLIEDEEDEVSSSLPDRPRTHRKASMANVCVCVAWCGAASSTYSVTSMDALWEKHPRRLSEAGLRRSSDGSSSDAVRKLSDDLSRKHLSDLIEDEEDEVSSSLPDRPRTHRKASMANVCVCVAWCGAASSTYSVTSMDALWEKHPRRLSEAGLRRSSDHSVVLTEDTDSFIIGERVWVGGTKPGQIAYIGETQFAPGDWAGIVLDDPIGKNDGSVAGVRYFQCAEKRGVFSRLTRLTRTPLVSHAAHDASPTSDASSVFERPPSGAARYRRTLSPNGSVRSVVSSKMNASISTTTNGELRLGDRVIVSSSRGSKAGTLKYVGVTEFAPGVWAGVELDDPLGKNDGSVDGKRYFECAPRFGLFAPIAKVSRSPSNRKPGACAIHSNGRMTPMRRSNSRESLTSLGTSVASSRVGVRLGVTALGAQVG